MKVLILHEPGNVPALGELPGAGEITIMGADYAHIVPKDPSQVDIIIGHGSSAPGSALNDSMLGWRTHAHTYLVPCWFAAERKVFEKDRLWPWLAIDRFDPDIRSDSISEWLSAVVEWQQNRMQFGNEGSLQERTPLELATSLCLRRANGVLSILDEAGAEGNLSFRDGNLVSANLAHLRDAEAFYEFLCLPSGWYRWDSGTNPPAEAEPQSVSRLIAAGLQRVEDANLLYRFIKDFDCTITKTNSESALDDSATASFPEQKQLYELIDGQARVSEIISASSLSRPTTMSFLAKWFSLEDIKIPTAAPGARCRVLVVDDSPLMCRALQAIFAEDSRIELAGIAHDGMEALRLIGEHKPDVVTLDLQMPKMDGLTALKHILISDPKPVVVVSAFTRETSRSTYESFKYGAVDVISKPANGLSANGASQAGELCDRVVQASSVQLHAVRYIRKRKRSQAVSSQLHDEHTGDFENIVVVICGEGGFPGLLKFMFAMPDSGRIPPVIVATAMPRHVVEALVLHLKNDIPVAIEEISEPKALKAGVCHFICDDKYRRLLRDEPEIRIEKIGESPRKSHFFDELLTSAADSFKSRLSVVLISGTGKDGVEGMSRVRQAGGMCFALSPEACLKPDLPQEIINLGYANEIKTITDLAAVFDFERSSQIGNQRA
jgi:two-component system chemotaxis response regulator CheB